MDFLWVRYFDREKSRKVPGFATKRLQRLQFTALPEQDDEDGGEAFGFLDPSWIIRGAHLIPAYALGQTLKPSPLDIPDLEGGEWEDEEPGEEADLDRDWNFHYVNM